MLSKGKINLCASHSAAGCFNCLHLVRACVRACVCVCVVCGVWCVLGLFLGVVSLFLYFFLYSWSQAARFWLRQAQPCYLQRTFACCYSRLAYLGRHAFSFFPLMIGFKQERQNDFKKMRVKLARRLPGALAARYPHAPPLHSGHFATSLAGCQGVLVSSNCHCMSGYGPGALLCTN